MARKVDAFPDIPTQTKYPWDEWLDGSIWELTQGEDFNGKPLAFRSNARAQAKRRGGRVQGRVLSAKDGPPKVYIQFVQEED